MSPPAARDPVPPVRHPCRAWSEHAEDLAVGVELVLERWEPSPTTARLIADGYLRPLGRGVHLPPHDGLAMCERAVAVGCVLGESLRSSFVIAGASAAWVSLGGDPPPAVRIISPARPEVLADVRLREAHLRAEEIEHIGGCPVTVPGRTAVDVLRFEPPALGLPLVAGLVAQGHVQEREITRRLLRLVGMPQGRLAREGWERVLSGLGPSPAVRSPAVRSPAVRNPAVRAPGR